MSKFSWSQFYCQMDLRSLGLFRIFISLVLIGDWLATWPQIETFYSSIGVFPLRAELPRAGGPFHFSLLNSVESPPMLRAAFLLGLGFYLGFLVGYRTRVCQIGSLLFLVSVLNRNGIIRTGADAVLVTMLLWSIFLPLGARFSWDARGVQGNCSPSMPGFSRPSLAAFCIIGQIAVIYLVTALHKHGPTWRDGTAVYYALHVDQVATEFGVWLREQPLWMLKVLTWATVVFEYLFAPLVFVPFGQPWLRRMAMLGMILLHLGIAAAMNLGMFPWVMLANLPLLLLPADWDAISRVLNRFAQWLPDWLNRWGTRWHAADTSSALDQTDSSVSRPNLTRWERTRLDVLPNLLAAWLMVSIMAATFSFNFASEPYRRRWREPSWIRLVTQTLQLNHDWKLFAPNPLRDDGWWVVDGVTRSGARLDPLTGREPTFEKPRHIASQFDIRWRKYLYNISQQRLAPHRLYLGRYLTRKNHQKETDGNQLVSFDIYYLLELTQPPGTPQPFPVEKIRLWHHECFRPTPEQSQAPLRPEPDSLGDQPSLQPPDESSPVDEP